MPLPLRFHSLPRQATTRIPTTTGDRPGTRTLRRLTRNLPWTGTLPPSPGPRRLQPAPVRPARVQVAPVQPAPVQPAPVPAVQAAVPRPAGPVRRWSAPSRPAPSRPAPTPVSAPTATASLTPIRRRLPEVPTTLGPVQLNRHLGSGWSARKATWAGVSPLAGPKGRPTPRLRRRTTNLPPPRCRPPSRSPRLVPALDRTGGSRLPHHLQAVDRPATVTMDRLLLQRTPCGSPSTPWLQPPPLLQTRRCMLHMPHQHRCPLRPRQRHQCPRQLRWQLFLRRRPQRRPTPLSLRSQLPLRQQKRGRVCTSACPTALKQRPGVPRLRPGRLLRLPTSRTYPAPTTRRSKSLACSVVPPWSVFWAGS